MAFRGWKVEALEFFEGLEVDNSKSYWQAHKNVYDDVVRAPMEELLAELEPDFGQSKIFRPYRDIRFSKDKSPYKTAIGATVGDGYVQLDARGLAAGSGMWEMAPDQLERYRAAVVGAGRRAGRLGPRRAEDRPEGLSEGPSADRASPLQGPDHVARVASRRVARHEAREGSDRRLPRTVEAARRMARRPRGPFDDARARPALSPRSRA
jgi:hypothetical protein